MSDLSNGKWKMVSMSLLSALLAGAGVVVANGRSNAALDTRITTNEERLRAVEARSQVLEAWMIRVEAKLDKAIDQRVHP